MNKKFLVIGNPIEHSLSPKLHNYWIKKNNLNANYDKRLLKEEEIKKLIETSKKDLDASHDDFVKSIQSDLQSFKKKTLDKI